MCSWKKLINDYVKTAILGWCPAGPALVGYPSSDGVMIKMPYGVDVLHRPALHPIFSFGLVKSESGFIVRSFETGLGR